MDVHLRFGMHRDVEVLHSAKELLDGMVIPAHILAYQANSTSVFVTSMHETPYVVDPMTFIFQSPKSAHLNDKGELRASVQKLCDEYHSSLGQLILKLPGSGYLSPTAFKVDELCKGTLDFQLRKVSEASNSSGAMKYLKRYGMTKVTLPRCVLPPYFRFDGHGDEWYQLSLNCANETARQASPEQEVAPVICCAISSLTTQGITSIADDYAEFDRAFVWVDNYQQTAVRSARIKSVRSLIAALNEKGLAVETLYGGFLMILSRFDGLRGISHGILYTQHKSVSTTPGSGGAPERYYIPAFREFRSLSQADLILHRNPELMCDCPVCEDTLAGNPDNFIRFSDEPARLRRHFLEVRRREADDIEGTDIKQEIGILLDTYNKYHESVRELPNPDAVVSGAQMDGLAYLKEWAEAFS
ncbi:MAG: hypothetical protein IID44_26110 [Planctomycetes bacterium]|nr:hypothetical protein [Planctomycetota bacterium]